MPRRLIAVWIALAGTVLFTAASPPSDRWKELLAKLPADSNAIVLMNVEKIKASAIAKREDWASKSEQAFAAGMKVLPPSATLVLEAAQIDFETWQPQFEMAILQSDRDISLANIARQTRGRPDVVANLEAVVLPQDAYIVALDKRHAAGLSPANRQTTVRWLHEIKGREKSALSPYLQAAAAQAGHIDLVEALDMRDAIPPDVIRAAVGASEAVAQAKGKVDVDKLAALLATLQGVTFEVVFKDQIHARFLVDLGQDAQPLAQIGKPLLLEVLRKHGAWIEDFGQWTPSVSKQQFVLTGTLTSSGLRKVLSLIDAPVGTFTTPGDAPAETDSTSAKAYASHAYFKAIQSILVDLRKEAKDSVTLGQNAAWISRWARNIERLPILNVDKDLLDYGDFVVAHLRGASNSLKAIGINSAYRSAGMTGPSTGVTGGYYGRYGNFVGYFGETADEAARRGVRTEERTQGAANALSQFGNIDEATAAVRRTMTDRYKMEF